MNISNRNNNIYYETWKAADNDYLYNSWTQQTTNKFFDEESLKCIEELAKKEKNKVEDVKLSKLKNWALTTCRAVEFQEKVKKTTTFNELNSVMNEFVQCLQNINIGKLAELINSSNNCGITSGAINASGVIPEFKDIYKDMPF